jgi:hypothetical protein
MSTIDISLGFRHISPQELRNYANLGLIVAGNVDLTEFCSKLLEDMVDSETYQSEVGKAVEEAEESSDKLENLREMVREAVAILEAI